ncbi:MAG: hypothetical protein PHF60_05650, partial [Candidatus ainarchaeum sp.]|nr:hypothetical protein [Candidatus ainarchaeum sp.]
PDTIQRNAEALQKLGINPKKIATNAALLCRDPETIQRNADLLQKLGITPKKIATHAQLLGMNPDTIQRNADSLQKLGLTPKKIASRAELLGINPETIQRNYEFLRKFLPKETICRYAQLLGNSPETVEGSVQFIRGLDVGYVKYHYLHTTPNCKRKKILTVAKERYGYLFDLSMAEKIELVEKAKEFIRNKPYILAMSGKAIKREYGTKAKAA